MRYGFSASDSLTAYSTFSESQESTAISTESPTCSRVRAGLERLHPDLADWTVVFAYGKVLARPALPLLERELLAVSILTAMAGLDAPLRGHARAAERLGASRRVLAAAARAGAQGRPSLATRCPRDPGGREAAAALAPPKPRESPPHGA